MTSNHTKGDRMFKDRFDAGQQLANRLKEYANDSNALIMATPRVSYQIGTAIADVLQVPLDIFFNKKIGYPGNPDYTIGMVTLDDIIVDKRVIEFSGEMEAYLKKEICAIRHLLRNRAQEYYKEHTQYALEHKTVIIVDEGMSTGRTIETIIDLIKKKNPAKIIIAVPVASKEALHQVKKKVDEVICLQVPDNFMTINQWYLNTQTIDEQELLVRI
jgi:predicted phosphoribosyltransferase